MGVIYSYDRTAAVRPLVIDEIRVSQWVENQTKRGVEKLFIHKGPNDLTILAMVNHVDGTHAKYKIELRPAWKPEGLTITPVIRGVQ